jgi:hypothetical protein
MKVVNRSSRFSIIRHVVWELAVRKPHIALRSLLTMFGLVVMLASALPASAQQQPGVVNPQASSVSEQQLLDQLRRIEGRGTIPDTRSYVIEQPAGRQWRTFHQVYLHWIGGIAICAILILLVTFYLWHGPLRFEGGRSGHKMLRFTVFEHFVHWMTAVCFVILASRVPQRRDQRRRLIRVAPSGHSFLRLRTAQPPFAVTFTGTMRSKRHKPEYCP